MVSFQSCIFNSTLCYISHMFVGLRQNNSVLIQSSKSRLTLCIAVLVGVLGQAQSQVSSGGGGSNSTAPTITKIRTGIDTRQYPAQRQVPGQNDPNVKEWYSRTVKHNFDLDTWYIDDVALPSGQSASIPNGWSGSPNSMSASVSRTGMYMFFIQYPQSAQPYPKSVWTSVNSYAQVAVSPPSSCEANDGQGDTSSGSGSSDANSHGTHLRKVSINNDGAGVWTVSVNLAGQTGQSSTGSFESSIGSDLTLDPRSIWTQAGQKKHDLSTTSTYSVNYLTLDDGQAVANGVVPTSSTHTISVDYANTEAVPNILLSTSSMSLTGTVLWGIDGSYYTMDYGNTYGHMSIDLVQFSGFAGATDNTMQPTTITSTFAGDSASKTSWESVDQLQNTHRMKTYYVYTDKTQTPIVKEVYDMESNSGSYSSNFSWQDGLVGEVDILISFKHRAEPVTSKNVSGVYPVTTDLNSLFADAMPGYVPSDAYGSMKASPARNDLAAIAGAMAFVSIFPHISITAHIVVALMECSLTYALESTYLESEYHTKIVRGVAEAYWTIDNWGDFNVPPGKDASYFHSRCGEWRMTLARDNYLEAKVLDLYDANGYYGRQGAPGWKNEPIKPGDDSGAPGEGGESGNLLQGVRWYHYRYVVGGSGAE